MVLAASVCRIAKALPRSEVTTHICRQLVRCGTSPAANYAEARSAESRRDFIHKMKVCLKELRETLVWLKLLKELELATAMGLDSALQEADELIAIFVTSVATAQKGRKHRETGSGAPFDVR